MNQETKNCQSCPDFVSELVEELQNRGSRVTGQKHE